MIRAASRADTGQITGLYRKLYEGDEGLTFYRSVANPARFMAASKVFVAIESGRIVGFCWCVYYEHIRNKGSGYIEELFVERRYRRSGIGSALVREGLRFLKREGAIVVFVFTGPHSTAAKRFYRAVGFRRMKSPVFVMAPLRA